MFPIVLYHPRDKGEEVILVNHLEVFGVEILAFLVEVNLAIVAHAVLNGRCTATEVARGMSGIAPQRSRKAGCEECGLALGEVFGGVVEIVLAGSLAAIDAIAKLNDVEIALHDAFFAPYSLD
jgi:hypothetical protein